MPEDRPEFVPDDDENEVPASVAFMEMMRQAASRSQRRPGTHVTPASTSPAESAPPDAPPPQAVTPSTLLTADDRARKLKYEAALEAERVKRVRRRQVRRRRNAVSLMGGMVRSFIIVFAAAGLMATIFTWWTPTQFIASEVRSELSVAQATSQATPEPTGLPTPNWLRRIGIVSGHRGPEGDPGAVCPDGLTEAEINFGVAQIVVRELRGLGFSVDLLDEFDPRLDNYQAAALVSIHANTCMDFGEYVSGFLIAAAAARATARTEDNLLVECVAQRYQQATGLQRREGVTVDMTDYHTFREIHPMTPAAIIEMGFMLADREILTQRQDVLARGIIEGVICFLEPQRPPEPTATPLPG